MTNARSRFSGVDHPMHRSSRQLIIVKREITSNNEVSSSASFQSIDLGSTRKRTLQRPLCVVKGANRKTAEPRELQEISHINGTGKLVDQMLVSSVSATCGQS